MKLRHLPYYLCIILFSCVEPTLVPDKDCSGVIGGDAIVDECGVCRGAGKTGCDNTCGSTLQLDCTYPGVSVCEACEAAGDTEGDCAPCLTSCGGDAKRDCDGNCNGTHHLEYFCEESEPSEVAAKNKDDITLSQTGSGAGTATITISGTEYTFTVNTDMTTTASDFVTANASAFLSAHGITLTAGLNKVTLEKTNDGAGTLIYTLYSDVTGDLDLAEAEVTAGSLGIALDLSTNTLTCFAENENGNCGPNTNSCFYVDCTIDSNKIFINTVIDCSWNFPTCDTTYTIEDEIDTIVCEKYDSSDWKGNGVCNCGFTNCEEFAFDDDDCPLIDCNGYYFSNNCCINAWGLGCVDPTQVFPDVPSAESSIGDTFCDDGNDDKLPLNFNCEKWGFDGASCSTEWAGPPGNYSCDGEVSGGDCSD